MLLIYRLIISLVIILSPIVILFRLLKKKEDPIRVKEKFCFFSKKKKKGKLIWFHGASVGEILSVIPLIEKLEKDKNINQILVTSNTLSSSKILDKLNLKKTSHQFFPIDSSFLCKKFLNHWKPTIAIFIDSEVWPNMIMNIKERFIPLVLLNARITKKSFNKWKIFPQCAKFIFNKFDICLTSSLKSKKYLKLLGAKKIKYFGNLKFSQSENTADSLNKKIKKDILSKKIWCAASTHKTEEKFCGLVHKKLKSKNKKLLTIIIPRHIDRTENIIEEMEKLNLNVQIYSSKEKIKENTDIYIVNTYGKTKAFFKVCEIVFLGGSIIKHGGQNPLESVRYGCKILHGPHISNFSEVYNLLEKYKVSHKINNPKQMANKIDQIFKEKKDSLAIKNKIKDLGNKILNSTIKEVNFLIDK